jgi:hypothetical protein
MIRLFAYYGSKVRASGRYPLPLYDTIVEPFAGAAGYSCRYADRKVILYDSDPKIAAILAYLINVSAAEIMSLPLLGVDESVDDFQIPQEARWLLGMWINNGTVSPCKKLSKWARAQIDNMPANFWGPRCRERLSQTVEKIKHWKVYADSWQESGRRHKEPATWFIDPPYQGAGHHYSHSCVNYAALAMFSRGRLGQTIVCENVGATWLPFRPLYKLQGAALKGGKHKQTVEAMWYRERTA